MESFVDEEERYETVKPNDGGGYRYIVVIQVQKCHLERSLRELIKRALNLYFDQDGCNIGQKN